MAGHALTGTVLAATGDLRSGSLIPPRRFDERREECHRATRTAATRELAKAIRRNAGNAQAAYAST